MRLLHTADWHLGRRFNHWDLLDDQAAFADWLVELVVAKQIDAVLVAGDVFDRAVPPQQAVELADETFARLLSAGVQVVATSGNHDSAPRLSFGTRAMAAAGLHIRTERRASAEIGAALTLTGRDGQTVTVLPVPYLDPLRMDEEEGVARTHHGVVAHVVERALADWGGDPASALVLGHAFVAGGVESESERALSVGGSSLVDLSAFGGAGYVALGHLHRPQRIGTGEAWYSGSPLAYSFSEEHEKQVRIVELTGGAAGTGGAGAFTSSAVAVGVGRRVVTLKGTLDEILNSPAHAAAASAFVRVQLTDATHQLGAMEAVRRRFPFAAELAYVELARQPGAATHELAGAGRLQPREVIGRYLERSFPGHDASLVELVERAYARAASGEDDA